MDMLDTTNKVFTEVKIVEVSLSCSVCGVGTFEFAGETRTSYPALLLHKCNHCGNEGWVLGEQYPNIIYVRKED